MKKPYGTAKCGNGDIVVAEFGESCITILNKQGKKVRSFGTMGTKKGQFSFPRGVAITNDGHILVTDDHRLQKLTTDGVCVKSVGSSKIGSGRLQFNAPVGITVHPTTGQIYVADRNNNRIQVFNNNLTFSHTIIPSGNHQFNVPYDVALDNEGYLYVAEHLHNCITKLNTNGQYITRFGTPGSTQGQPSSHTINNILTCVGDWELTTNEFDTPGSTRGQPSSLTIYNNIVYVSDWGNNRVSMFDTNGTFFHCFGKTGSREGDFNRPHGLTIDGLNNLLYVSDIYNDRIVVY